MTSRYLIVRPESSHDDVDRDDEHTFLVSLDDTTPMSREEIDAALAKGGRPTLPGMKKVEK